MVKSSLDVCSKMFQEWAGQYSILPKFDFCSGDFKHHVITGVCLINLTFLFISCAPGDEYVSASLFIYFFKHRKPVLDRLWFQPDRNLPCEWCISLSGHIWRTWSAEGHCSASTEGVGIFNIYSYSVAIHNTVMYEVIKVCKNKNMLKCSMHPVYKCSD